MTAIRCLITLSDGHWHRLREPDPAMLDTAARLEGIAFIADVDEQRRTARLICAIKGDGPARLAQWCRLHGFKSLTIVPPVAPTVAAVAARPNVTI